MKKWNNLRAKK